MRLASFVPSADTGVFHPPRRVKHPRRPRHPHCAEPPRRVAVSYDAFSLVAVASSVCEHDRECGDRLAVGSDAELERPCPDGNAERHRALERRAEHDRLADRDPADGLDDRAVRREPEERSRHTGAVVEAVDGTDADVDRQELGVDRRSPRLDIERHGRAPNGDLDGARGRARPRDRAGRAGDVVHDGYGSGTCGPLNGSSAGVTSPSSMTKLSASALTGPVPGSGSTTATASIDAPGSTTIVPGESVSSKTLALTRVPSASVTPRMEAGTWTTSDSRLLVTFSSSRMIGSSDSADEPTSTDSTVHVSPA